ncbi:hypothetical protein HYC85_017839 [Camellia sinensis]|uniref:Uncharacterized protein n=1 Tax=Camellia sinensis TaxID=4442 RepID=A0A7J7GSK1_CAMSI|nr:hypothetical protein HYC85_017839 [Camellia sinensis]
MGKSNEASKSKSTADIGKAIEEGTREAETMMKGKGGLKLGCNDETLKVGSQSHPSGYVRSLSESLRAN